MSERPRRRPQYVDDNVVLSDETEILEEHHEHHEGLHHSEETRREYVKFAGLILGILLVSIGITTIRGWDGNRFANDFMAVFFMTFAAFKFFRIEEFVAVYRTYDILAKKYRPWPYIFPFILLFIFNRLPSALTWYYTVSNVITLALQFVIQNYIIDHDKIVAKLEANRKKPKTKPKWQERFEQMQETQRKIQAQKGQQKK